ncbi:MAG: potassium/proton antiporter [Mycobacteriales bacterium]
MSDSRPYAFLLLIAGSAGIAALLSGRLSRRLSIPAPAVFLIAASIYAAVVGGSSPDEQLVERIVTVALLCILFDGGMHIGWDRMRGAAGPVLLVGVLGTFLTTGALAAAVHVVLGVSWYVALLVGTALAPTDPAVVFSVLGQQEVGGRSGTVLEGESGANDPVGIALLVSLLAAGSVSGGAIADVGGQFVLQMGVGAVLGLIGGHALLVAMRRVSLPSEGLYPLQTLAAVLSLYGLTTLAHGSGFLAVFVAGIVIGEERAPFKREIERFHGALASLAEIVAFVVLGLTVDIRVLGHQDVWLPALAVFAVLTVVIRPLFVGACLLPARLARNETLFVLFAGLKGAVPILLGFLVLHADVPSADRLYGVVVVVVMLSVVLQGGLVPTVARALRVPMRERPPQPFALGVRLADEPENVVRLVVEAGSFADGATVDEVSDQASGEDVWVNLVVRDQALVRLRGDSRLRSGDEVIMSTGATGRQALEQAFATRPGG